MEEELSMKTRPKPVKLASKGHPVRAMQLSSRAKLFAEEPLHPVDRIIREIHDAWRAGNHEELLSRLRREVGSAAGAALVARLICEFDERGKMHPEAFAVELLTKLLAALRPPAKEPVT